MGIGTVELLILGGLCVGALAVAIIVSVLMYQSHRNQ
jgi:hypothetical protein